MANSARFSLPLVASGQSGGEVTHNTSVQLVDALMHIDVLDRDLATPPGSPSNGDTYLVGSSPTGAWSSNTGNIAIYNSGWTFITPVEGMWVYVADEDRHLFYDGSAWRGSPHLLYVNTASSSNVTNTTSETNFDVYKTLAANYLNLVGRVMRLSVRGTVSLVSSATYTIKVKWGTTDLVAFPAQSGGTTVVSGGWGVNCEFVVRATGASGSMMCTADQQAVSGGRAGQLATPAAVTVDLTASTHLYVSATWSAASGSNAIKIDNYILEVLN